MLFIIDCLWVNISLLYLFLAEAPGTSVYSILSLAVCLAKNCTGWKVISRTKGEITVLLNRYIHRVLLPSSCGLGSSFSSPVKGYYIYC